MYAQSDKSWIDSFITWINFYEIKMSCFKKFFWAAIRAIYNPPLNLNKNGFNFLLQNDKEWL